MESTLEVSEDNRKRSSSPLTIDDDNPGKKSRLDNILLTHEVEGNADDKQNNDGCVEPVTSNAQDCIGVEPCRSISLTKNLFGEIIVPAILEDTDEVTNGATNDVNDCLDLNEANEKNLEPEKVGLIDSLIKISCDDKGNADEKQKNDGWLEPVAPNAECGADVKTFESFSSSTKNLFNETIVPSILEETTDGTIEVPHECMDATKANANNVELEEIEQIYSLIDNGIHVVQVDTTVPTVASGDDDESVDLTLVVRKVEDNQSVAPLFDDNDQKAVPMTDESQQVNLNSSLEPRQDNVHETTKIKREEYLSEKPIRQHLKASVHLQEETTDSAMKDLRRLFGGLNPIPTFSLNPMNPLTLSEVTELESVLEFSKSSASSNEKTGWRNDWCGNLSYVDKEIRNPLSLVKSNRSKLNEPPLSRRAKKAMEKMSLLNWTKIIEESRGSRSSTMRRLIKNLFRHVCTYSNHDPHVRVENSYKVPQSVINLLGANVIEVCSISVIEDTVRRASYDPQILEEDGWTVERTISSQGATGGAFRIGEKIRYEGYDAVVIAYTHDSDIGDLWKAIWLEDFVAFDLEAEELNLARQKWEKYYKKSERELPAQSFTTGRRRAPSREVAIGGNASLDFTVEGVEYGIVLASSYSKGARPGVYWPARIMHASETSGNPKRNSSKTQRKLELVFLAAYWHSLDDATISAGKNRVGPPLSENEEAVFNTNPLFHFETVDATDEMVREYPSHIELEGSSIDITQLRMSFRFTGLPKTLFSRYLDAYRLASCLRAYAKSHLAATKPSPEKVSSYRASAALFEAHPLSVQVPMFPPVILHLPYSFVLSQLTSPKSISNENESEPLIHLNSILDSMKPPLCWGQQNDQQLVNSEHKRNRQEKSSSAGEWLQSNLDPHAPDHMKLLSKFVVDFPTLNKAFDYFSSNQSLAGLIVNIRQFVELSDLNVAFDGPQRLRKLLKSKVAIWAVTNNMIETSLSSFSAAGGFVQELAVKEWRQASELIYRHVVNRIYEATKAEVSELSNTVIITDSLCNEHRTSDKCLERRVRLPAAIKAAKLAGAKDTGTIRLVSSIDSACIDFVEKHVVNKAHSSSYLKRMKSRCASALTQTEILVLTDDSDDNGGQDTRGSQGTWNAALCGVAAAVSASDKVVRGESVNAFCVTRPPGHHAGRSLHPMKAVSNGFCILNPAACAAIYATTPVGEGGLGLQRVCVIDFDVHHGNGTQDILCSVYDPRFLYVSLHAGGAHINGIPPQSDPFDEPYGLAKNPKLSGIYPGRCGDTSPHKGVLNIPLGSKVMSHAVGTALLQHVTPAVETFSPELIILSAGFDAHKNDPMGLGGLSAEDFGNITELACQLALKTCSGRIVSILEGGYGVPCCRPQQNTFLPESMQEPQESEGTLDATASGATTNRSETDQNEKERPQPSRLLDLGDNLPFDMDDQVPYPLQLRLEKCHAEGFVECVFEHVSALARCAVDRKR